MRQLLALVVTRFLVRLLRLFGRGATSLPGKAALALDSRIVRNLASGLDILCVTGTNGKTTTTLIIGNMLKEAGIPYFSNRSGSNLLQGIAAVLAENAALRGDFRVKVALLEVDEAAFDPVCDHLKPRVVVVTNFFRDQLDRYGELYSTLDAVRRGIRRLGSETTLVLNADDSLCASLAADAKGPVLLYGVEAEAAGIPDDSVNTDAMHCIRCKERYQYHYRTYGHLGGYNCPGCGYHRPEPDIACVSAVPPDTEPDGKPDENADKGARWLFRFPPGREDTVRPALPGLYNVYNSLAAAACGHALGLPAKAIRDGLAGFRSGFGRMETIPIDGRLLRIILVKNPAGFNQVLELLKPSKEGMALCLVLNDRIADGRDVSWIWDVDFESFRAAPGSLSLLAVAGDRCGDMALRLKYAGFDLSALQTSGDAGPLLLPLLSSLPEGGCLYLLPTYTAMLSLRRYLERKLHLRRFWQ